MTTSIRLGRLFGIPIGVQPAWLVIVALIAWSLGAGYYPEQVNGISAPAAYGLGLASALLLFAGILLHELGHALVARRRGVLVEEIDLWLLGGVAKMSGQPSRAADELAFAAAGPAVTAVLAVLCGGLAAALPDAAPGALRALVDYLFFVNVAILALNLLPAFPLDGGRIALALIWSRGRDLRQATIAAARLGRALGWGLIALGVLAAMTGFFFGLWTAVIGFFVISAAKAEERGIRFRTALAGRRAGMVATPFPGGPLELDRLRARLDPELLVDEDTDLAELIERPAFARAGRAVVRRADGGFGLVSMNDLEQLVWAFELGGKPAGHSPGSDGWREGPEPPESGHAQTSNEKGPPMKESVVIAGGGVAAMEAALALQDLAGDRVEVTICSPRRDFVYRPYAVGVPYGVSHVATYDLERLATAAGARYRSDSIAWVNKGASLAVTHDGESIPYGDLIVCPGTKLYWPVPGAITFWGIADERDVGKVMAEIRGGQIRRVAFTMPAVESWALPLYELALLARAELDKTGDDAELTIVTPEDAPLQVFGRRVAEGMARLLAEHRIDVITGAHPVRFEHGQLETVPAGPMAFDKVVSLPKLEGRRIRGVPHDVEGFVHVDAHCGVLGCDHIYAAGDVTGFPVKQGGLATQQADVAAEAIAARLGVAIEPAEFEPVLRGVLWTGGEPLYLQGWPTGGHGENSTMTDTPPWGSDHGKIVGRHLTEFLAGVAA